MSSIIVNSTHFALTRDYDSFGLQHDFVLR